MSEKSYIRPDVVGGGEYDPMKEPRYAEIATFMRAPLARLAGRRTPLHCAELGLLAK